MRQSWVFNKPPPILESPSVVLPTPILDKNGLSAKSRLSILIMQKGPGDRRISNGFLFKPPETGKLNESSHENTSTTTTTSSLSSINSEIPKSLEELFRQPNSNYNNVDNNSNQLSEDYRSVEPVPISNRPLSHASSTTQDSDYDALSDSILSSSLSTTHTSIYTNNRDSIITDNTSILSSSPTQNDLVISEQINASRHYYKGSFQPLSITKENNSRSHHRYSMPPPSSDSSNNISNSRNVGSSSSARRSSMPIFTSLENVPENPFSADSENTPVTTIAPFITVFEEDEEYENNYNDDKPKKQEQEQEQQSNLDHLRRDSSYCSDDNTAFNLLLLRSSISSVKSASMLNAQLKSRGSVRLRMNLMMQKRHNIAWEILTTERHYVDCLLLVQRLFLQPLLRSLSTANPILTKKFINEIFANFLDLVSLNTELLRRLENRIMGGSQESAVDDITWNPEIGCVGDIFLNMGPFFKMYSIYVKNFNSALAAIDVQLRENPAFSSFLRNVIKTGQCKGLTLQAYLIMPVQRIPRYKLLLEDLLKKTDEKHLDYLNLKKAYQVIENVATFVNETIRQHEMFITMLDIQKSLTGFDEVLLVPARTFIKRGTIKKICRRNHQEREFFLFSDILIYASPGIVENLYNFHRKFELEDVTVISLEDTAVMKHCFQLMSPQKSFTLYADTLKEKEAWINAIREAKEEYLCAKRTLKIAEDNVSLDRKDTFKRKRIVDNYHAPVWVPDTSTDRCMNCSDEFTIFRRKHHCRACGKIICHACSTRNFVIPGSNEQDDQIVRACDPCLFTMFPDAIRDEDIAPGIQVWNHKPSSILSATTNNSENKENDSISSKRSTEGSNFRLSSSSNSLVPNVRGYFRESSSLKNLKSIHDVIVAKQCELCRVDFSVFRWRNVCFRCKKIVCTVCLTKKPIDLTLLPEKFFLELLAEQIQPQQESSNPRDSLANCSIRLCDVCFLGIEPNRVIVNEEGGGWMVNGLFSPSISPPVLSSSPSSNNTENLDDVKNDDSGYSSKLTNTSTTEYFNLHPQHHSYYPQHSPTSLLPHFSSVTNDENRQDDEKIEE
ncbi:7701_t:CDS:10 [Ambispora gerdemannii]|uniref:7701_t:CDS:1 n=1 Tax=Ambispora gerdemannii TaxID=144530 RepID=A0A9N8YN61_9GLOM|nr:7701_t:CDS:10 [Ambispora gerdemannii]